MDKIKFSSEDLKLISFFDKLTGVHPKDCFIDSFDNLVFVVSDSKMGLAVGKGGLNVKKLKDLSGKSVRVVSFVDDICVFVKNVFRPVEVGDVSLNDKIVLVKSVDVKNRGLLIGRGGSNLRNVESIVKRFFDIDEVKIE